jgi:hypothetical protein
VFARPTRRPNAIVDTLDLGTATASAGDAGAHPTLSLRGRRPSSSALRASRRNGRGVGSPKTGRGVDGVKQRVGKPRVIVLQDGQAESRTAMSGWRYAVSGDEAGRAHSREEWEWKGDGPGRRKSDDCAPAELRKGRCLNA